eukprot:m.171166 g.171166  ORF g.171166 m.171166 type:complete len:798 (+) comp13340_c0_seq1:250-2643(+)
MAWQHTVLWTLTTVVAVVAGMHVQETVLPHPHTLTKGRAPPIVDDMTESIVRTPHHHRATREESRTDNNTPHTEQTHPHPLQRIDNTMPATHKGDADQSHPNDTTTDTASRQPNTVSPQPQPPQCATTSGLGFGCVSVETNAGTLKGNVWSTGEEFLTVPYATVPKRFQPPVLRARLPNDPFDATNILGFGQAACMQGPYYNNTESYGVEDCLIMNLYRPRSNNVHTTSNTSAHGPPAGLPILVWIFGGDNTASEIIPYNATTLAGAHNALVAVVSYRLGIFGWSAFPDPVSKTTGAGNNGLLDVLMAARWLKEFGPQLGGDPSRMVVFGESSGATDAQIMTLSPLSQGVFQGSIAESGGLYANSLENAINSTLSVAEAVGCSGSPAFLRACLEDIPGPSLVEPSGDYFWGPTVDGVVLPDDPTTLLHRGKLNPGVSVLWGALTNDSANAFTLEYYVSRREYIAMLNASIHGAHGGGGVEVDMDTDTDWSMDGGDVNNMDVNVEMETDGGVHVNADDVDHDHARLPRRWQQRRRHVQRVLSSSSTPPATATLADGTDPWPARPHLTALASRNPQRHHTLAPDVAANLLERALELYPPRDKSKEHPYGDNAALVGWYQSDQFMCAAKREVLAASRAVSNGGRAFLYRFDWFFQSTSTCVADSNYHNPKLGPNHADDMTFVFGQPIFDNQDPPGYSYTNCSDPASVYYDAQRCVGCAFDTIESTFAYMVGEFWTQFARSGDAGAGWQPFNATRMGNIVLHPNSVVMETNLSRTPQCELWDEVDRINRLAVANVQNKGQR